LFFILFPKVVKIVRSVNFEKLHTLLN
jgi:hypothetical protein